MRPKFGIAVELSEIEFTAMIGDGSDVGAGVAFAASLAIASAISRSLARLSEP